MARFEFGVATAVFALAVMVASPGLAKGSSGGGKAQPVPMTGSQGTLVDELVNGETTAFTLSVTYSLTSLSDGQEIKITLSGPGTGSNRLPFLASVSLNGFTSLGAPIVSLPASNYDPTGLGSQAYLTPSSVSKGGVELFESVSSFEGAFTLEADKTSGSPIGLTLTASIPAAGYGQVTLTNAYQISPISMNTAVPEPASAWLLLAGVAGLGWVARTRIRV